MTDRPTTCCSVTNPNHGGSGQRSVKKWNELTSGDVVWKQQWGFGTKSSRNPDFKGFWTFAWGSILKVDLFKLELSPRALTLYPTVHPEINTSHFGSERSVWDASCCRLRDRHRDMSVTLHTIYLITDIGQTGLRIWFPNLSFQGVAGSQQYFRGWIKIWITEKLRSVCVITLMPLTVTWSFVLYLLWTLSWCYISHHQ